MRLSFLATLPILFMVLLSGCARTEDGAVVYAQTEFDILSRILDIKTEDTEQIKGFRIPAPDRWGSYARFLEYCRVNLYQNVIVEPDLLICRQPVSSEMEARLSAQDIDIKGGPVGNNYTYLRFEFSDLSMKLSEKMPKQTVLLVGAQIWFQIVAWDNSIYWFQLGDNAAMSLISDIMVDLFPEHRAYVPLSSAALGMGLRGDLLQSGVVVTSINPISFAAYQDIRVDDVIREINDKPVRTLKQVSDAVITAIERNETTVRLLVEREAAVAVVVVPIVN